MTAILTKPPTILPESICIQKVNSLTIFNLTKQLGDSFAAPVGYRSLT